MYFVAIYIDYAQKFIFNIIINWPMFIAKGIIVTTNVVNINELTLFVLNVPFIIAFDQIGILISFKMQ